MNFPCSPVPLLHNIIKELKGLRFIGLVEDIRSALDKDVDVFDVSYIVPDSRISSEIAKDGVTIYLNLLTTI